MANPQLADNSGQKWLINFMMGGVAATISKTCAAPIVSLLLVQTRHD